jgi:hypothetical protein
MTLDFSRSLKPTNNWFIERDYNDERPHSSIGNKVPIESVDGQRQAARPDQGAAEKGRQPGLGMGSGSNATRTDDKPAETASYLRSSMINS